MKIEQMPWDSNLFGYKVGKITITGENELDIDLLQSDTNKLLYIFSDEPISGAVLKRLQAVLVDEKTALAKYVGESKTVPRLSLNLHEINSAHPSIIDLALQSGIYSRFYIDTNFISNEFLKLYTTWIEKSIKNEIAEKVVGFKAGDKFIGLITIGIEKSSPAIGLLSVDKTCHRKNIGTQLLDYAVAFSLQNKYPILNVTTQGLNTPALNFYIKNGFRIIKKTYIYHLWK